MARPEKNTVEYFPFICDEGNKMFYIEETYGNDGFATFVKLCDRLANVLYSKNSKSDIVAKISGGADIMNLNLKNSIGSRNVEFAKEFCQKEGFRIISEHVRGEHGRLILLADNFETFIKVTQKSETDSKILSNEKSLQIEISKAPVIKEYTGAVELFGANKKKIEETMEIELF